MKRSHLVRHWALAAALAFGCASSGGPIRLGPNLELVPLASDVWVVDQLSDPYQANALLVRTAGGPFVLVDTPNRDSDATLLVEWMERQHPGAFLTVINSHSHPDASGSNRVFLAADATVRASDRTMMLLREQEDGAVREPNAVYPLDAPPTLEIGGETVRVFFPGPSHAPDDVVVHFPDRKLLFGSCLSKPGDSLGYLGDADLVAWRRAMDAVAQLDVTILVPGHGRTYTPEAIANTIRLLEIELGSVPDDREGAS